MDEHASYLSLIFALKHLRIRFHRSRLTTPSEFTRDTALVQGDRLVPPARDADLDAFLRSTPDAGPGPDPMWELLGKTSCEGWPEAVSTAVRGITAFGPGDSKTAAACARRALLLDRGCILARQLVSLLRAPFDPRVPFGAPEEAWPDLPTRLARPA